MATNEKIRRDESVFEGLQSVDSEPGPKQQSASLESVYRKVDFRLVAWYSLVYLVMKIDASNITNTAIMNLEDTHGSSIQQQLGGLDGRQWAWVLSIFYYPYVSFEPISTILMKRFRPSVSMSRIMITWGIISMCQAATHNYTGILITRFMLGLAEAGFSPGVLYHLSFWYPTRHMTVRLAFFYALGHLSGAVSGLLAFGISSMDGIGGLSGWRWCFILEGSPAVLCGILTGFMLPNYPETSSLLDPGEKKALLDCLSSSQPSSQAETFSLSQVQSIIQDPCTLLFMLLWASHAIGGNSVKSVLPTVIYRLGLTNTALSQLLTIPTFVFGSACVLFIGWLIHRRRIRSWPTAVALEIVTCGCYIVLITVANPVVRYLFVTLATACSACIFPVLWPERIDSAHGTTAAALAIGLTSAAASLSGIVGPHVYQEKFGPSYRVSFSIAMGLLGVANVTIAALWWILDRRNRKASLQQ